MPTVQRDKKTTDWKEIDIVWRLCVPAGAGRARTLAAMLLPAILQRRDKERLGVETAAGEVATVQGGCGETPATSEQLEGGERKATATG
jgi:hypothetical protein